jgi:hypothetical protein
MERLAEPIIRQTVQWRDASNAADAAPCDESLTHDALANLSRRRGGVDFATTLLYERVRESPRHGPFIREIDSIEPDLAAPPRVDVKLLVAPAAFWKQYPQYGGDGCLVRQIAEAFGMETRVAPVPSTASVSRAADVLVDELSREPDRGVILASLSKGGADVRIALERRPELARKLWAWLQIAGVVHGTPVVNDLLTSPWWRRGIVSGYLACTRADPQFVRELAWGDAATLLRGRATAPAGVMVINVVGFPLACHLAGNSRKRHQRMAPLGPNDGSTLLRDAIVDGGFVYPVWGADHYMRVPQVRRLLYRLFTYLARST